MNVKTYIYFELNFRTYLPTAIIWQICREYQHQNLFLPLRYKQVSRN